MNNRYNNKDCGCYKPGDLFLEINIVSKKGFKMEDINFIIRFYVYGNPELISVHKDHLFYSNERYYAVLNENHFASGWLFCNVDIMPDGEDVVEYENVCINTGILIGGCAHGCNQNVGQLNGEEYTITINRVKTIPGIPNDNPLLNRVSISKNRTWIVDGVDTGFAASPLIKNENNKLYYSYDNINWSLCSEEIAAYFRFKVNESTGFEDIGTIQISRDNINWSDLSPVFTNNLRIKDYVSLISDLPLNAPAGTVYGVGPTYSEDDTIHLNPIYTLYVWNGTEWINNGRFTSIAAGIVQEIGNSETEVMSQKATTREINGLSIGLQNETNRSVEMDSSLLLKIDEEINRSKQTETDIKESIDNESQRAKDAETMLENSINSNRYGYNVTINGLKGGIHNIETAIKDVPHGIRMLGQKITFRTERGDWATYHNESLSLANYENINDWVQEVGIKEVTGDLSITNAPDYEDLTETQNGTIKLADKEYSKSSFSGLGRIYLRKNIVNGSNILTQDIMGKENTRYIIQYDYDLDGSTITIPQGSVLDFQGGSIKSGTIIGNYTQISGETNSIFDDISIEGTWNVPSIKSSMFLDAEKKDCIKNMFALSNDDVQNEIVIEDGQYIVTTSWSKAAINLTSNTILVINGTIALEANNYAECFVLGINEKSNIHIKGKGVLSGDKLSHTGNDGEWGHGVNIIDSHNIFVSGITIKDCWGDCIYVGGTNVTNVVRIDGCVIDNGRRQGISVSGGTNIIIENCVVKNIKGTAPESGIDIEPNGDDIIHNVCIRNNYIYDCSQGILVGTTIQTGLTEQVSIENNRIINCNGRNRDGSNTSNASSIFVYGAENYNTKNIVVKNNVVETFTSGYTVYFSNVANVLIEGNRIVNSIKENLAEYPILMAFFSIPDTITLSSNTLIMPSGAALRNAKILAIANTVTAAKMFPFDNVDLCEFNNNNIDARLEGSFSSCVFSSNTFSQLVYFNSNSKRNIIRQNKFASLVINGGTEHNDVVFNNITNLSVQDPVGYNFANNKISQLSSSSFYDCRIKENDFTNIATITKLDNSILENNKFSDLDVTNVVRTRMQKNTFSGNFTMQYASYSNIVENNFKEVSFGTNPISNTIFDRNICDGNIVCYILNTTVSGNKAKKLIVNSTKQSCIVNNILEGGSSVLSIYGGDTTIVKNNIVTVTKKDTSTVNVIYIACSHSTISENIINPNNTARYAIQLSEEAAYNNIVDNIISSDVASGGRVVGPNTSATNYFDSKNRNRIGSTSQRPAIEKYNNTLNETEKFVEYYDNTLKSPIYWNGGYWQYEDGTMALTRKGSTAQRPTLYNEEYMIGFEYYDTDLKKKILWNGSSWTNIDGTSL